MAVTNAAVLSANWVTAKNTQLIVDLTNSNGVFSPSVMMVGNDRIQGNGESFFMARNITGEQFTKNARGGSHFFTKPLATQARTLVDGLQLNPALGSLTTQTVTINQFKEASYLFSQRALDFTTPDVIDQFVEELRKAISIDIENTFMNLYSQMTYSVGSISTQCDESLFGAAQKKFADLNVNTSDYDLKAVVSTGGYQNLTGYNSNYSNKGDKGVEQAFKGNLKGWKTRGFEIVQSSRVQTVGGVAKGMAFAYPRNSKQCPIVYSMPTAPELKVWDDGSRASKLMYILANYTIAVVQPELALVLNYDTTSGT